MDIDTTPLAASLQVGTAVWKNGTLNLKDPSVTGMTTIAHREVFLVCWE